MHNKLIFRTVTWDTYREPKEIVYQTLCHVHRSRRNDRRDLCGHWRWPGCRRQLLHPSWRHTATCSSESRRSRPRSDCNQLWPTLARQTPLPSRYEPNPKSADIVGWCCHREVSDDSSHHPWLQNQSSTEHSRLRVWQHVHLQVSKYGSITGVNTLAGVWAMAIQATLGHITRATVKTTSRIWFDRRSTIRGHQGHRDVTLAADPLASIFFRISVLGRHGQAGVQDFRSVRPDE